MKQRSSKIRPASSRVATVLPGSPPNPASSAPLAILLVTLALLLALVSWPLLDPSRMIITDDGFVSDATMAGLPFRAVLGAALRGTGSLLWCPEIYSGFPLHALPEAGFFYPPHWLLGRFLDPVSAAQVSLFLHLLLAGAGAAFLLGADGVGLARGTLPALYAALAFAGGGFLLAHLKHLSMVEAAAYLPWLLAGAVGLAGRDRRVRWVIITVSVAGMGLAGHPQILAIGLLAAMGLSLAAALDPAADRRGDGGGRARWTPVVALAGAIGIGLLAASVQLYPAAVLVQGSERARQQGAEFAEQIPLEPANLATMVHARASGMAGDGSYARRGIHWEDYSYQGLLTWPLAIAGLLLGPRRGRWRWVVLAGLALLLALGARGGIYPWFARLVPGLGWFRFPARFLVLTELSAALLAAAGLEALASRAARRGRPGTGVARAARFIPHAAVLFLALDLAWAQRPLNGYAPRARFLEPPATLADLVPDKRYLTLGAREAHLFANQAARGWVDVEPYLVQRRFLQPSLNLFFGARSADGYANPVPEPIARLWGDHYRPGFLAGTFDVEEGAVTLTPAFFNLARLGEVRTLYSLWPLSDPRLAPLAARPPVFSYALPEPLPHARLVVRAIAVPDPAAAAARMAAPEFDPARETILLAPADAVAGLAAAGDGGTVTIERRTPIELDCRIVAAGASVLRVSESFDPGWEATVDGTRAPVFCADLGQQAVPVPAGEHRVQLRYRPQPFRLGAIASLAGTLGIAFPALTFLRTRRRRRA